MVQSAACRRASTIKAEVIIEAAAPAWASTAAVGHVQVKVVPIIINVVDGDSARAGKITGLLLRPHLPGGFELLSGLAHRTPIVTTDSSLYKLQRHAPVRITGNRR